MNARGSGYSTEVKSRGAGKFEGEDPGVGTIFFVKARGCPGWGGVVNHTIEPHITVEEILK